MDRFLAESISRVISSGVKIAGSEQADSRRAARWFGAFLDGRVV